MGSSSFIKVGHVGYASGKIWDEKGHNQIVQIFISHDEDGINSIQFQYIENRNMVLSDSHGKSDGSKFDVVKLNYPTEYITWISGYMSTYNISSVTFGTNCGKYGPFGKSNKIYEEFKLKVGEGNQFGGLHGAIGQCDVNSIGIYLKPNMTLDCSVKKKIAKRIKLED